MSTLTDTRPAWLYGQPQLRHDTKGCHKCWCGGVAICGGKWCSIFCRDREEIDIARTMGLSHDELQMFKADLPDPIDGSVESFRVVRDGDPIWMRRGRG